MKKSCHSACASCLMPADKDPGKPESTDYCSFCFRDGRLCYQGNDLAEFQRVCYAAMRERGINFFLAKLYAFAIRFAPRWQKPSS